MFGLFYHFNVFKEISSYSHELYNINDRFFFLVTNFLTYQKKFFPPRSQSEVKPLSSATACLRFLRYLNNHLSLWSDIFRALSFAEHPPVLQGVRSGCYAPAETQPDAAKEGRELRGTLIVDLPASQVLLKTPKGGQLVSYLNVVAGFWFWIVGE